MSARGLAVSALTILFALAARAAAADSAFSRAQAEDLARQRATASQPAEGAVSGSMQYLGTVPRRVARSASGTARNAAQTNGAYSPGSTSRPAMTEAAWPPLSCFDTPWFQQRTARLPQHRRDFANRRYFGGLPNAYGYGDNPFYLGDPYGDVYRFGFLEGRDFAQFEIESNARTDANLAHAATHLDNGLTLFRSGHYAEAADAFRLAADTNQGDPAARLYAAHSLFAVGRYQEGVGYLRRAFELQPRIIYLSYDVRDDYGQRSDFDSQLEALKRAIASSPTNTDRLLMLGYLFYYTKQRDRAYPILARAAAIDPRDALVRQLLQNARPPDVELDRPVRK